MYDEYFWVHSSKAICGRCGWSVSPVWMEEIYFQLRLSSGTNRSSELFLPLYKQTLQRKRKKTPRLIFSHSTILHIIFLLSACYAIFFSTVGALVFITVKRGIHSPTPTFGHYTPAHSYSILTFPNNIYRHTCYCLSNVTLFE